MRLTLTICALTQRGLVVPLFPFFSLMRLLFPRSYCNYMACLQASVLDLYIIIIIIPTIIVIPFSSVKCAVHSFFSLLVPATSLSLYPRYPIVSDRHEKDFPV